MKEHEEGYSMPLAAPTFGPPPFYATPDSRIILMVYKADPEAMAWEVPEPLEMADDGTMLAWIGDMGQRNHSMDVYHEALTCIKVKYEKWSGWYCNYIWVDHDMALTFSREIYGWPANLCDRTSVAIPRQSDPRGLRALRRTTHAREHEHHQPPATGPRSTVGGRLQSAGRRRFSPDPQVPGGGERRHTV